MDINELRSLILIATFAGFLGVWRWAWRRERQRDFAEAAHLPLEEDPRPRNGYRPHTGPEKP